MSEFSGKQFYGFATNHNTHLGATTDNFDFQHLRPGYLDRVSQKDPKEMEPRKDRHTTRSSSYNRRATTPELLAEIGMLKRDTDVETQIASNKLTSPIAASHSRQVIRELSNEEIERLILKVKPPTDMSPRTKKKYYPNLKSLMESSQQTLTHRSGSISPLISPNNRNPGILRKLSQDETFVVAQEEDLNKTYNLATNCNNPAEDRTIHRMEYIVADSYPENFPQIIDNVRMEEYRKPLAKWVEILEPQKEIRSEIPIQRSPIHRFENTPQEVSMHYHMPAMLMTEAIANNVRMAGSYMNVDPNEDNGTTDTYIVEESDLEFEMFDRENYMKYNKTKPLPEEILNLSIDEEGSLAEFIAIENGLREMDVTYLRNKSPLRFTEVTEDTQEDTHQMKVYINSRGRQQHRLTVEQFPQCSNDILELHEPPLSTDRCSSKPSTKTGRQAKLQAKTVREEHLQRTFERLARGGSHSTRSHTKCAGSLADSAQSNRSSRAPTNPSYSLQTRAEVELCSSRMPEKKTKKAGPRLTPKSLKISKSIEDFKLEKSNIYKKMSATQEKIIEVLDKLRISLLELNVPDNSFDKTKRQRNAFEFAVRFSRNFLYPLKGMLEDIKSTPIEQFNSLTSNDACLRVCHLYSLLLQSVNTYQKQLRYFLLDHVPQKLPILIEMIYMATLECLEKQIFSREDIIIDCLQQRCTKFLDFLQDLEEGRLNTVRENHRKLTLDKATPKYDLKMFMNKLNMYEPKLVPKAATHRKKAKAKRPITSVAIDEVKDSITERTKDENIPTQIQRMPIDNKSSTQFNMGAGDCAPPVLDKTVVEALQNVTKEQVRKVLEPILASLGSALGKQTGLKLESLAEAFTNVNVALN